MENLKLSKYIDNTKSKDKTPFNWDKIKSKIEWIKNKERIYFNKKELFFNKLEKKVLKKWGTLVENELKRRKTWFWKR